MTLTSGIRISGILRCEILLHPTVRLREPTQITLFCDSPFH